MKVTMDYIDEQFISAFYSGNAKDYGDYVLGTVLSNSLQFGPCPSLQIASLSFDGLARNGGRIFLLFAIQYPN